MKRREFIVALGGTASWPLAARAQQAASKRRIAMLLPYLEADSEAQARVAGFRAALSELGWSEGRNVELHFRWAANDPERLRAGAVELAALAPEVIVTPSTVATAEVQRVTSATPIVFVNVIDPIGSNFVSMR
jgi:putative ABC transport system substrate-binding protein